MILITGGTGTSGKPIVQQLATGSVACRVLVRNPLKAQQELNLPGVSFARGDFNDRASLEAACAGVECALLNSDASPDQVRMQSNFIKAAKKAGVRLVVKFSVQAASPTARFSFGRWHGITEEELKASGMAWTMLQPTFFMQNLLGMADSIRASGAFHQPAGDGKAPYVDVRDIAAVAVKALTEPGHESKSYPITGPADLSCNDIAAAISKATGKPVTYVDVPRAAAKDAMLKSGLPGWRAESLCELMDLLKEGAMAGPTDVVRTVAKRQPITFDEFARAHVAAFV
jgi:uncharacterized protein YbjT (DUF2867 family)